MTACCYALDHCMRVTRKLQHGAVRQEQLGIEHVSSLCRRSQVTCRKHAPDNTVLHCSRAMDPLGGSHLGLKTCNQLELLRIHWQQS